MRLTINTRLQLALNLVIVTASILAVTGMVLLVFWFEKSLFYNHLQSDLLDHVHNQQVIEQPLVLKMTDTTYYKLPRNDMSLLPKQFQGYPEGGYEVLSEGEAYNIFTHKEPYWIHILVQDQSEFERYEVMAFSGIAIGIILIFGLGFILSKRLSRQILSPIKSLADEVASLTKEPKNKLKNHYPNDETGQLAKTFNHYVMRVNELLLREQQFAANVSHELRTPMMVMRGSLDMLAESELPTAVERQLNRINIALEQMQQQTELFLQLSRTPDSLSGNDELQPLAELASSQLEHWKPLAESRNIGLELNVKGEQASQPASMVIAVLNNLLRNAMQHTVTGKITVELTERYLRVADTGSGLGVEAQAKAEQRGYTEDSAKGFGLGLAIVKQVCEHQGWQLRLAPNPGGGTEVTVYFVVTLRE